MILVLHLQKLFNSLYFYSEASNTKFHKSKCCKLYHSKQSLVFLAYFFLKIYYPSNFTYENMITSLGSAS